MNVGKLGGAIVLALTMFSGCAAVAEDAPGRPEHEYPFPIATVETALRQMGAYTGARLPGLAGFTKMAGSELPHYERPYYEYKIELVPVSSDRTRVRVKASISAWYQSAESGTSGYQAMESNGRLERDLLDRLDEFLTQNKTKIVTDPEALNKRLAAVRQQHADAERRIAELEKQLHDLQAGSADPVLTTQYVSAARPVSILSAPSENASVLLRAQPDDEFQVLERRGAWLRVQLDEAGSGWVRSSQVKSVSAAASNVAAPPTRAASAAEAFTVTRESASDFSGDWPRLQGKQALYVWVQPQGSALHAGAGQKLQFAEGIFRERYQEISHSSKASVEGVVVIFLDERGGVAAASLEDIARWSAGELNQEAFLKKCSLDPPGAFGAMPVPAKTFKP